jgi:guanosine-3',5'-bis(diphosphate) 3'-pyrophosphohydrolase
MNEQKAKAFALKAHEGQKYGEHAYAFHLEAVVAVAKEFELSETIIAGCWLHDTIEDCKVSYQDIKTECGAAVAEIVFCVTDELGRNRKERKLKTYPKIACNEDALCVKLCDRIANVVHSIRGNNLGLLSMYLKEHGEFREQLHRPGSHPDVLRLWSRLDAIMAEGGELLKRTGSH